VVLSDTIGTRHLIAGSVTATELSSESVTTDKLAANAVTADKVLANSIGTEKLAVGSPNNVIWNSCPSTTVDGWAPWQTGSVVGNLINPCNLATFDSTFMGTWGGLGDQNGLILSATSMPAGSAAYAVWAGAQVAPGDVIEGQFAIACPYVGITVSLRIDWLDASGANVGSVTLDSIAASASTTSATSLADLTTIWGTATAPAGAASTHFSVVMTNTSGATIANPFAHCTRAYFGRGITGQTEMSPWAPGGITQISGGVIKSNTIVGRNIAGTTITGDKMVANTITAAQVAAGTLTTTEIATGTIKATNLDATDVIANFLQANTGWIGTAQIGDLQVDSAKIADLTVGTQKITGYAVISPIYASNTTAQFASATIFNTNFTCAYPSSVMIFVNGVVDYGVTSGSGSCHLEMYIDNSTIVPDFTTGTTGEAQNGDLQLMAIVTAGAGNHNVKIKWVMSGSVSGTFNLDSATMSIWMNYR
jgi:hypothetical protein